MAATGALLPALARWTARQRLPRTRHRRRHGGRAGCAGRRRGPAERGALRADARREVRSGPLAAAATRRSAWLIWTVLPVVTVRPGSDTVCATLWVWRKITVRLCTRVTRWTRCDRLHPRDVDEPRDVALIPGPVHVLVARDVLHAVHGPVLGDRVRLRDGRPAAIHALGLGLSRACIASDAAAASTAAPHNPFRYVLVFRFSKLRRTLLSPGMRITEQRLASGNRMIP